MKKRFVCKGQVGKSLDRDQIFLMTVFETFFDGGGCSHEVSPKFLTAANYCCWSVGWLDVNKIFLDDFSTPTPVQVQPQL